MGRAVFFVSTLCEGRFRTEPRFLCHSQRLHFAVAGPMTCAPRKGVVAASVVAVSTLCLLIAPTSAYYFGNWWFGSASGCRCVARRTSTRTRLTPFAQPIECVLAHAAAQLPKAVLHSPPSPQAKVLSSPTQMAAISPAQRTMTAARARSAMGMATPSPRLVGGAALTGSRVRYGVHRWTAGANWASEGSSTRYVYSFQRGHDVYGFTVSPKLVLKWLQCTNTAVPMSRDVAPNVSTHPASLLFVINVPHTAPCVFLRRYLGLLFLGHSLVPMGGWSWVLHSWLQYVCGAA